MKFIHTCYLLQLCWLIISVGTVFSQPARIRVRNVPDNVVKCEDKRKVDVELFYEGESISGYNVIFKGATFTFPATFKCNKSKMISMAIQECDEYGLDGIYIYDIREPSILSTCYRFNIKFLKKVVLNDID